jgi:RNA recognition motif-containing protein
VPKKLYVGNLAYSVTDQDLRNLFSQSGAVESVAIISDRESGQSKGFGFVEMPPERTRRSRLWSAKIIETT